MTNKFAATYYINKYEDGDGGDFGHELLELSVMFEHMLEEDGSVGEYTDTCDHITHTILGDKPVGYYRVFILGEITYSVNYWGEHDIDVDINYESVFELPKEHAEEMLGLV